MKRLLALLIAELLCLTLLCIGIHLIFWQHNHTGALICGAAAVQSVLIVLILVFTEDADELLRTTAQKNIIEGMENIIEGMETTADLRKIAPMFHAIAEKAAQYGWTVDGCDKIHVTFRRTVTSGKAEVMNVYWNTKEEAYTVQTTVNHPKTGRKQLNRRGLSQADVFNLLEHPRAHTDKGYYKK